MQEKTALLRHGGQWLRPHGATPTTHILKLPLGLVGNMQADMSTSIENEWLCSRILRALGLPVKLHADQLSNLGGAALAARLMANKLGGREGEGNAVEDAFVVDHLREPVGAEQHDVARVEARARNRDLEP